MRRADESVAVHFDYSTFSLALNKCRWSSSQDIRYVCLPCFSWIFIFAVNLFSFLAICPPIEHMIAFLKLNTFNRRCVKVTRAHRHAAATCCCSPRYADVISGSCVAFPLKFLSIFSNAWKFTFCWWVICSRKLQHHVLLPLDVTVGGISACPCRVHWQ